MSQAITKNYLLLIYEFRGCKVMLDFDLAVLYGVETRVLKQAVRRNSKRFPEDFMFELSKEESLSLRSQFVTLKRGQHSKYVPFAFTEQGVAMLSSVLKSEKSIDVNIEIMRAFVQYRSLLKENEELKKDIKNLDSKINDVFKYLLKRIDALHQKKGKRKPVGFKINSKNNY